MFLICDSSDFGHNEISDLRPTFSTSGGPFETLGNLHDLMLHHNNIRKIERNTFKGLRNLQVLYENFQSKILNEQP